VKITEVAHISGPLYSTVYSILTKTVLARYILGEFSTSSSGHPVKEGGSN
jgi:hypothetical protein